MTLDELHRRAQLVINGQRSYMSRQDAEAVLELVATVDRLQSRNEVQGDIILRFNERFLMLQRILGDRP